LEKSSRNLMVITPVLERAFWSTALTRSTFPWHAAAILG
jgi:hypothetical protein